MTKLIQTAMVALGLAIASTACQAGIVMDFVGDAKMAFNPESGDVNTFQFRDNSAAPAGDQWHVDNEGTGFPNYTGTFGLDKFTFGPISGSSATGFTAPVSLLPPATLTIHDGFGSDLTGSLTWNQISTLGGSGGLNVLMALNVSGLSYSGTQADLAALRDAGAAKLVVTFQNSMGYTLPTLGSTLTPVKLTYSGSLSAVPEPSTYLAGLGALGMLGMFGWRNRK